MGLRGLDRPSNTDRIPCRKCWKSTWKLKSLLWALFIVFIIVSFDHSRLGGNCVEDKNTTTKQPLLKIVAAGVGDLGTLPVGKYIWHLKRSAPAFLRAAGRLFKEKYCSFWKILRTERICKGLIEAFWDRLHEDCANCHFRNLSRYCVLKSGVEALTPCMLCIFPKNGSSSTRLLHTQNCHFQTQLLYNHVPGATLRCSGTRVLISPSEQQKTSGNSWGGGLCKFLSGSCPAVPPGPAFRELIHCKRPPGDLPLTLWPSWSLHPWFCFL